MIFVIHLMSWCTLFGQTSNLGQPPIFPFLKKQTSGGTQTWDIKDDGQGNTWFANNAGVLRFDGSRWEVYPLPSGTIVRSLAIGENNRVYAGGQGEFGYFSPDIRGVYKFTPLSEGLPESDRNFGDVWHVITYKERVFFRSDHQLFVFDGKKVTPMFMSGITLNFMGLFGNDLVIQDENNRLFRYDGTSFNTPYQPEVFDKGRISAVISLTTDTILLTTIDRGIFYLSGGKSGPWKTQDDARIRANIIYCAAKAGSDGIVLGTSFGGVTILNNHKQLSYLIGKENGLPNNTILSVCGTQDGNVWVGTDNGIALINFSAPVRFIYPDVMLEGTGYDAAYHQDKLYLGTNTGLYSINWKKYYSPEEKSHFQKVSESSGQVWDLQVLNDRLLMGHHNGGYIVEGMSAIKMEHSPKGVWKYLEVKPGEILTGHYDGITVSPADILVRTTEFLSTRVKLSSRFLYRDSGGQVWMSHPYRGIYRILPGQNENSKEYVEEKFNTGSLSGLTNNIYLLGNETVVHDDTSFYRIMSSDKKLVRLDLLNRYIRVSDGLKFFTEDGFGNIWYATREETGLLIPSPGFESAYKKHLINYLNGLLPEGFQKIIVIDRENVLIPAEKGFIHFNPSKYLADTATFYIKLASIQIKNQADSTVFSSISCQKPIPDKFSFNSNDRALTFRFTTCDNTAFDHVDYRYQLAGDNNQWSDWTDDPIINYNNLASGEYLLRVQARNGFGKISHTVTVVFYISPPWYKSLVAYGFYSIGLLGLMIYLLKKQDARHKADKERIHSEIETKEMVYRQQAELSQLEINRLQNEKLEAEIRSKNNELTSYTYHLVNKNDLIQKIREEVSQMEHKFHNEQEIKKDLRNILRLVDNDEELDEDWENFVKSFDQVHADFYRRLNEKFTDLSPSDYKLCTYLKMNLTSKEIASLMNISIRSVETNRYRLRKKLNLDHDENLTQFILKF